MKLWTRAEVLRLTNIRANQMRKMGDPGPEGSIGKMASADLNKDIYDKVIDLLGAEGLLYGSYAMVRPETAMGFETLQKAFLRSRANSIEGGTTEVMKNILGERVLGLPGDVRVDRDDPLEPGPSQLTRVCILRSVQADRDSRTALALNVRSSIRRRSASAPPSVTVAADLDGLLQLTHVARRREVLVLFGHLDDLHALARRQAGDDLLDQLVRRRRSGRDAHDRGRGEQLGGQLVGRVDADHVGAPGLPSELLERSGVRRVGRADDDDGVAARGQLHQRRLAVRRGEAQVAAPRRPDVGEPLADGDGHVTPVAVRQRGLSQQRHRLRRRPGARRPPRRTPPC